MDDFHPVTITLPLVQFRTVHALAFKAPTTGHECAFALVAFHQEMLKATAPKPNPAPAPDPAPDPAPHPADAA